MMLTLVANFYKPSALILLSLGGNSNVAILIMSNPLKPSGSSTHPLSSAQTCQTCSVKVGLVAN